MGMRRDSVGIAELKAGDPFDVLEVSDGFAWGIATRPNLVGYVDCFALEESE